MRRRLKKTRDPGWGCEGKSQWTSTFPILPSPGGCILLAHQVSPAPRTPAAPPPAATGGAHPWPPLHSREMLHAQWRPLGEKQQSGSLAWLPSPSLTPDLFCDTLSCGASASDPQPSFYCLSLGLDASSCYVLTTFSRTKALALSQHPQESS